jgi:hypothetical protein
MEIDFTKSPKAMEIQTAFIFEPREYPLDRTSLIV